MTCRRTTAAGVVASIWLATLAIGAPTSAASGSEARLASASSELQAEYPLHEPRRCCSNPAPPSAAVEPPRLGPGDGANDFPWAMPLLLALLAALGLGLVLRLIPPTARAISATVTARHADPTIDEHVYVRSPPRPRHLVRPIVIALARPLFRYSWYRRAYVLRLIGERHGPALEPMRVTWQPRPRHTVSPIVIALARPLFRYSRYQRAYVLRLIGERHGPILRSRSSE
jgi:hypothetical protein